MENLFLQIFHLLSGFGIALNWQEVEKVTMKSQPFEMTLPSNFFDIVLFPFSTLVTVSSIMSTSLLVVKLLQFSFIRDSPKIRKLKYLPLSFT